MWHVILRKSSFHKNCISSALGAVRRVRRTAPSAHNVYRLKHILPLRSNDFNDVFLLTISTETVTLARFRRMLPDDGPKGPKHVGAI